MNEQKPSQALAISSLVLGIVAFLCGLFAGIPAIILGHVALNRARKSPASYGGAGMATAGLILGYISVVITTVVLAGMLLPALAKAKSKAVELTGSIFTSPLGVYT